MKIPKFSRYAVYVTDTVTGEYLYLPASSKRIAVELAERERRIPSYTADGEVVATVIRYHWKNDIPPPYWGDWQTTCFKNSNIED